MEAGGNRRSAQGHIKLILVNVAHNLSGGLRSCGWGAPMKCVNLTDDELWRAIAENTNALSLIVEQRHELDAAIAASHDAAGRARLVRLHLDTVNRFQQEYRAYTAELHRRHLLNEQSEPDNWTNKAIGQLFPGKAGFSLQHF